MPPLSSGRLLGSRRRGSTRFFWTSSSVARSARSSSVRMFALPKVTSICSVRCGISARASSTPSFRRSSRDAALQLGGDVVVETLDRGDLLDRDVSDFLEAGEAFGDEQLRERLVDVELRL